MKWIITELFWPDESATAQVMTQVALGLSNKEKVHVICGPAGYEKPVSGEGKLLDKKIIIHRISIPNLSKNKLATRILRHTLLSLKMGMTIMRRVKQQDTILAVTNPSFIILVLALIKWVKKIRFVLLVHDVFPENLLPGKIVTKKSLVFRMLRYIYNAAYRKADRLILLGEDMKLVVNQKLADKCPPVQVITNWAEDGIYPKEIGNRSAYLGVDLEDKIVIGFAGNLGRMQGLPEFLECFRLANNVKLALVLMGEGAVKAELKAYIQKYKMKNVFLLETRSRSEQNIFINTFDIGLVCLAKGMKGLGVPSKTYNLMSAGKPIVYIGDKESEVDTYVNRFQCGWSFGNGDAKGLISFIKYIDRDFETQLKQAGQNAHIAAKQNFSKDKILEEFRDCLKF